MDIKDIFLNIFSAIKGCEKFLGRNLYSMESRGEVREYVVDVRGLLAPHREAQHVLPDRFAVFLARGIVAKAHIVLPQILAVPFLSDALGESRETLENSVRLDGAGLVVQSFEFPHGGCSRRREW